MQSTNNTNDLIQRTHNLPLELFESIYDHIAIYSGPKTIVIDSNYTFPAEFHTNKAIRQSFAESYFSKTVFICYDADTLEKWVSVIPLGYQRLIKQVIYSPYEDEVFDTRESCRRLNMAVRNARPVMARPAFAALRSWGYSIFRSEGMGVHGDWLTGESSRLIAKAFAKDFYSSTFIGTNPHPINLWLDTLPIGHKVLIQEILDLGEDDESPVEGLFSVASQWRCGALHLSVSMIIVAVEADDGDEWEGVFWVRE
ncbi:hypothetical protein AC578_4730 [Pseudocercospora eumusae]|uniref:Uncharacterized protein n=1 Tax=Pseudocercospora eumusae TaxID=321146 RepID=A0A139GUC2_9PEZI|nr:hypothetical protein AC578_4730 [Pseudocercospora eumusae]